MLDDQLVEQRIDLDRAAAQISTRRQRWTAVGLVVGPLTWRDMAARWPQPLEQNRSRVAEADSVGVHVTGPAGSELLVVLFRGGWADVGFLAGIGETDGDSEEDVRVVSEAPEVTSPQEFGELLDGYVVRAFGSPSAEASRTGESQRDDGPV